MKNISVIIKLSSKNPLKDSFFNLNAIIFGDIEININKGQNVMSLKLIF